LFGEFAKKYPARPRHHRLLLRVRHRARQTERNAIVNATCIINKLLGSCEDALLTSRFSVTRGKGQPNIFRATGCVDLNVSGTCDTCDIQFKNVWIFNVPQPVSYLWTYLKLMQVRFYPVAGGCGTITTVL
jgi:hypothetical protein